MTLKQIAMAEAVLKNYEYKNFTDAELKNYFLKYRFTEEEANEAVAMRTN